MNKMNRFFMFRDPNDEPPKKRKNEEGGNMEKLDKDIQTVLDAVINLVEVIQKQKLQRKTVFDSIISLLQVHKKEIKKNQKIVESIDNLLNQTQSKTAVDSLSNVLDNDTKEKIREALLYLWRDSTETTENDTAKSINAIMSLLRSEEQNKKTIKKSIESLLYLFADLCKQTDSSDDGYSSAEESLEDSSETEWPDDSSETEWPDDSWEAEWPDDSWEDEWPDDSWEDEYGDDLDAGTVE